jgi:hypothetical protein
VGLAYLRDNRFNGFLQGSARQYLLIGAATEGNR